MIMPQLPRFGKIGNSKNTIRQRRLHQSHPHFSILNHNSSIKIICVKKFVIERNFPGAANMTTEEIQSLSKASNDVIEKLDKPYTWVQSYITGDKMYCIHIAESEDVIREHAKLGRFPINTISEIKIIIDPSSANW
jgi:hypothetical protein